MDKIITVEVTREHISKGNIYSRTCPIALAVFDSLGMRDTWVSSSTIGGFIAGKHIFIDLPRVMQDWVHQFDNSFGDQEEKPPKPFSFDIDPEKREIVAVNVG